MSLEALLAMGHSQGAHLVRDRRKSSLIESDDLAVGPHFKIVRQRDGQFHWELINPHGTTAARSMETFATEDEAAANAEYAQRLISRAPIVRS
jgi:uncharacterized protein YegP (UPF0339 family)